VDLIPWARASQSISSAAASECRIGQIVTGDPSTLQGALAQLVARFHGMEEVRGSSPLSSTHHFS
jgi:predicted transcriptional regulator with HTH domain